jgi:predicted SAM-dependent methyltransferase
MRLNLGCGKLLFPGYVNIDKYYYEDKRGIKTDVVSDLLEYKTDDNSVDEVLLIHVIEHFVYDDGVKLLSNIYKWLKKDGRLIVEAPDVIKAVNVFKDDPFQMMIHIFGDLNEIREGKPEYYHKWGWTEETMVVTLKSLGFNIKFRGGGVTHHRPYRDFRVEGIK